MASYSYERPAKFLRNHLDHDVTDSFEQDGFVMTGASEGNVRPRMGDFSALAVCPKNACTRNQLDMAWWLTPQGVTRGSIPSSMIINHSCCSNGF